MCCGAAFLAFGLPAVSFSMWAELGIEPMKNTLGTTLVALSFLAVAPSPAAIVTWSGEAFTDIAQVSSTGTLVLAQNLGQASDGGATAAVDIFDSVVGSQVVPAPFYDANLYSGPEITGLTGAETNDLLDTLEFFPGIGNSTFTLTGLTPGQAYQVQMVITDMVSFGGPLDVGYAETPGGTEVYTLLGQPVDTQAMIFTGTFTADADTQELHFSTLAGQNAQINAYQLRVLQPQDPLQIQEVQRQGDEVTIEWNSQLGRTYKIFRSTRDQFSEPLVDWVDLDDGFPFGGATSETTSFTDTSLPPGTPEAFYRVEENPPD